MIIRRILTVFFIILSGHVSLAISRSYPLVFGSFREVSDVHKSIDLIRRQRDGEYTSTKSATDIMEDWASSCPADTYLIIEQPGINVEDFQSIVTQYEGISLWKELRKFLGRCGTVGSFPRLDKPFDVEKFERYLVDHCDAKRIKADPLREDDPIEEYIDTTPRVIRLKFDMLPENDEFERLKMLQNNDNKIIETFRNTPSPFFSIIYTGPTGEEFGVEKFEEDYKREGMVDSEINQRQNELFRKQKHLDIFPDIVRQKKDPRNRQDYKQHEPLKPKLQPSKKTSHLPPKAQYDRENKKRKLVEERKNSTKVSFNSNDILDKDTVLLMIVLAIVLGFIYLIYYALSKFIRLFTSETIVKASHPDSDKFKISTESKVDYHISTTNGTRQRRPVSKPSNQ